MTPANLLNHLCQSTLFAVAAGLLTLALRNHRAPVRYWLWFTASAKFLLPFALLVSLGSHVEWRKAPAPASIPIATAPLPSVIEQLSHPFPPLPASTPRTPINVPVVLLCLWSCGLSIVVFGWVRQWLRLRTALRAASPLPLNLPIRVMSSPSRIEPGVFGVFRPVLLLPEGITDRLPPAQWDAILAHELCHVRRRDNLTAAIHMAVEAIFWFHPLVWWIGKRLLAERERACDEAVLLAVHHPQAPPPVPDKPQAQRCGAFYPSGINEGIDIPGTTMAELAREFSAISDRPVIDKTGIAGVFDLHLEIASAPKPPEGTPKNSELMTLSLATFDDALQKLGLKIEDAKAPREFLIIDSVERPTED